MRARLLVAGLLCGVASAALADGGRLRTYADAGDFRVAIFTSPEPLTAGPVDVSVLVQDRATGDTILDAKVVIELSGPGGLDLSAPAGRHARNRLFYGAVVNLIPGAWTAAARVRRGDAEGSARATFQVGGAAPGPARAWPYLSIPPIAVALYAANRGLRKSERRRRNR
jgi:hypothetical protein